MSLARGLIDDFSEDIVIFRNTSPQITINGVAQDPKVTQLAATASVQPLRGQEILMFSEGDRLRQSVKIYSNCELLVINEVTKLKADLVQWKNILFEIVSVERWDDDDFTYWKSIGRRKDRV